MGGWVIERSAWVDLGPGESVLPPGWSLSESMAAGPAARPRADGLRGRHGHAGLRPRLHPPVRGRQRPAAPLPDAADPPSAGVCPALFCI